MPSKTLLSEQLKARRMAVAWPSSVQDPRAPREPNSVRRNVSTAETCEFYGVKDAISQCRYPRSCRDCLAKPGCYITGGGRCYEADSPFAGYFAGSDYRNATFANGSAVSSGTFYQFLAGTATYCTADDSVCATCRAGFEQLAGSASTIEKIESQFCLGQDGCVCIAVCEVPEVFTRVYDYSCLPSRPARKVLDPPPRQNFTSRYRDPRTALVNVLDRRRADDSCAYYPEQDVQGCRRPRTCQDCLQRDGCAIVNFKCASMDEYDVNRDFRIATLDSSHSGKLPYPSFPSVNTTYCPTSDQICSDCRARFKSKWYDSVEWQIVQMDSEFCVGQNGCVCVEFCESELWSSGVTDTECNLTRKAGSSSEIVLALCVTGWLMLVILYRCSSRKTILPTRRELEQAAVRVLRHMLDEVPAIMGLDLFGWRRYYETLLQKEQQLLEGEELVSPVYHPVDFDFVLPSAPDFDDDDSSAPTAPDPRALASAPRYRASLNTEAGEGADDEDFSTPSAPDFDADEFTLQPPSEVGHLGVVRFRHSAPRHT